LKNTLSSANLILLCHQEGTRFDPEMFKMITEMESLFGRGRLWNNVMLEVTHWAYDQNSIKARESHGRNETTALKEVNDMIKKNSHLNDSLEGIFLDSYAVQEWNLDDEVQQAYFQQYAQELWEAAVARGNFSFLTIEDILEQLDEALAENDRLHDVIDESLTYLNETTAQLRDDVNSNNGSLSSLQSRISSAESNVEFNANNITSLKDEVRSNDLDILGLQSNMSLAEYKVDSNAKDITRIEGEATSNDGEITKLKDRMRDSESKVSGIDTRVKKTEADITGLKNDVKGIDTRVGDSEDNISDLQDDVEPLTHYTHQCAYRWNHWTTADATITYEKILIDAGSGSMDKGTGKFTAGHSGYYQVTISGSTDLDSGEWADSFITKNGDKIDGYWRSYATGAYVQEQGSLTQVVYLSKDSTLAWKTDHWHFGGEIKWGMFCVSSYRAA